MRGFGGRERREDVLHVLQSTWLAASWLAALVNTTIQQLAAASGKGFCRDPGLGDVVDINGNWAFWGCQGCVGGSLTTVHSFICW
mgnify:FL=1